MSTFVVVFARYTTNPVEKEPHATRCSIRAQLSSTATEIWSAILSMPSVTDSEVNMKSFEPYELF
jgi:hypothetical protein